MTSLRELTGYHSPNPVTNQCGCGQPMATGYAWLDHLADVIEGTFSLTPRPTAPGNTPPAERTESAPNPILGEVWANGFRRGADYALWAERCSDGDGSVRPATINPYDGERDESDPESNPPFPEHNGVIAYGPHPFLAAPEVARTKNGHAVLVLFPWTNDDHTTVVRQLGELLTNVYESIPDLPDPRTP